MSFLDGERVQQGYSLRGCLSMFLILIGGVFFCMTSILVVTDVSCVNHAGTWLPDYPDAELVNQDYTMVRAFGVGETTRVLYSTEDPNIVRRWYQETMTTLSAEGKSRVGMARSTWRVTQPEEGDGTVILLFQDCASGIF